MSEAASAEPSDVERNDPQVRPGGPLSAALPLPPQITQMAVAVEQTVSNLGVPRQRAPAQPLDIPDRAAVDPAANVAAKRLQLEQYQRQTAAGYARAMGTEPNYLEVNKALKERIGKPRGEWTEADFDAALSEHAPALRAELLEQASAPTPFDEQYVARSANDPATPFDDPTEARGHADTSRDLAGDARAERVPVQREARTDDVETARMAVMEFMAETHSRHWDQFGSKPERHLLNDLEHRLGQARGGTWSNSNEWTVDDWREALDVHAPAQRAELLGSRDIDATRVEPDHSPASTASPALDSVLAAKPQRAEVVDIAAEREPGLSRAAWQHRDASAPRSEQPLSIDGGPAAEAAGRRDEQPARTVEPVPPPLVSLPVADVRDPVPPPMLTSHEVSDAVKQALANAHVHHERARGARQLTEGEKPSVQQLSLRSPRIDELKAQIARRGNGDRTSLHNGAMLRLDALIQNIHRDVTTNPLWLAADHVAREPNLMSVDELLRQSPALAKAQEQYTVSEQRFVSCQKAVERFEQRPGWQRFLLDPFGSRRDSLRERFNEAARDLLDAKSEVVRVTNDERYRLEELVQTHNSEAAGRQREAQALRDELEQPLRSAVLERHCADTALLTGTRNGTVRDLPPGRTLEYDGIVTVRGLLFQQFRGDDGRTYFADPKDTANPLGRANLVVGDQVAFRSGPDGSRTPVRVSRVEAWSRDSPVQGHVGSVIWKDGKLERFQISDTKSGATRWVLPTHAHGDLAKELHAEGLDALRSGDVVHLHGGALSFISRVQTRTASREGR